MSSRTPVLVALLGGLITASACIAQPAAGDGFAPFWTRFRAAALAGDMNALATLSRLPLKVGFDSDQDHPRAVDRSHFAAFMRTELKCPSENGTVLDGLRAKTRPNGRFDFHDAHRADVGSFSFANGPGGWRLATINYATPADYAARLKGRC